MSPCVVCLCPRTLLLPNSLGVLKTAPVQNSLGISHYISKWTQTMSLFTYLMSIIGEDEASNTWLKVRQRYASGLIFRLSQEHLRKGSPQIDSEYWNGHVRMLCTRCAKKKLEASDPTCSAWGEDFQAWRGMDTWKHQSSMSATSEAYYWFPCLNCQYAAPRLEVLFHWFLSFLLKKNKTFIL